MFAHIALWEVLRITNRIRLQVHKQWYKYMRIKETTLVSVFRHVPRREYPPQDT